MATVVQGPSERDGAYYPDAQLEPDQHWKNELRGRISQKLQHLVDEARKEYSAHLINKPTNDYEHAVNESVKHTYEVTMTRIRRMAQEQFDAEMEHERQVRRLAAGVPLDEGWSETLLREQQSLWDATHRTSRSKDRAPSRLAFGGSTNAVAGPSRIGLDGHIAGDGSSSARYDSAYDDTARYSRWAPGAQPVQPQPEWPARRDGEQSRNDADPLRSALERWMPRMDEPSGPPHNAPKNPSKLGRMHFPSDLDKPVESSRRAGKQAATAADDDAPDDLRSFLANAELQLAMGDDVPRSQIPQQIPVHFAHVPHLYDRAQSVTPRPTVRPAPRVASKLSNEVEGAFQPQAQAAPQEVTRTDSYLFAIMQTTSRASASTPHPGAQAQASNTTVNVQIVDPRTFTVDDDARSMQSPYQPTFSLPDFRPPPPMSSQSSAQSTSQSSSVQSLWQSAGSRTDLTSFEQKSPKSDVEMVVVASDEGDSDWEASGFDKDELDRMIEAEMSNIGSDSATIVPEMAEPSVEESLLEDTPIPGALPEEPEEIKTKTKGGKAKKKEEARRKELEAKRNQEEAKRKAEETKRKEEEAKRKEEEAKRKAEETKRKEEEGKRKQAEATKSKPLTAQARRAAAAEEKRKAESLRRFEEGQRREEAARRAEEAQRAEEERRREEEQKRRDAEALEERLGKEKLATFIKQQEAWNKAEQLRKPDDRQRALEEARRAEAVRLERERLEEEKRKQEEAAVAEKIGKEKLEAFLKQQEEARRKLEGRQRTDSFSRTPPSDLVKPPVPAAKHEKEPPKKASEPQLKKRTVTFTEEDPKDREARLVAMEQELRRREQEVRRREEELARKQEQEEARCQEEDKKRKPGAPRTKADELRDKERQLRRQAEENQKKEQEFRKREETLNRRAEDILAKMKAQQEEFRRECLLMGMTLSK
ncbi:hypothetical protein DAEQUDRAFT_739691 [Daedalea quercina L-15889]|uniref:Uncharacterized protein n=1 Tax=Daedalea quercina L-15889 TaxID=1314783 RepID=A0A165NG46_9APHY|nr:hypothetical protein DAEQUDRAFT_739691 [Daedalea quercina L-15889]